MCGQQTLFPVWLRSGLTAPTPLTQCYSGAAALVPSHGGNTSPQARAPCYLLRPNCCRTVFCVCKRVFYRSIAEGADGAGVRGHLCNQGRCPVVRHPRALASALTFHCVSFFHFHVFCFLIRTGRNTFFLQIYVTVCQPRRF